ncbi:hypothetical protein RhiirC2_786912 [Rhizophagus irregularis]|uniref:Uncharacterized protein n=1 Tax=Rhizophagus irregularis TaxID=588596 RepID=A0A2N1MT89_9GLOM|nr:hypothetical protein RhiirC2_786912 [Rhizophagus irregularis]
MSLRYCFNLNISLKKLLRHADKVGESVQNIKVQRKRWYNDNDYQDCSTSPDGAPEWIISSSYVPNTDERNREKGEEEIAQLSQLSTHDTHDK